MATYGQSGQKFATGGNILHPGDKLGSTNNADLFVYTHNHRRAVFTKTGKVGIGLNHPTAKLDVNGKFRVRQNAIIDLRLTTKNLLVKKNSTFRSLAHYSGNFHLRYNNRTLVDKGYVDSLTTSTADNFTTLLNTKADKSELTSLPYLPLTGDTMTGNIVLGQGVSIAHAASDVSLTFDFQGVPGLVGLGYNLQGVKTGKGIGIVPAGTPGYPNGVIAMVDSNYNGGIYLSLGTGFSGTRLNLDGFNKKVILQNDGGDRLVMGGVNGVQTMWQSPLGFRLMPRNGVFTGTNMLDVEGNGHFTGNLISDGFVQCNAEGYKFPDGTVQTTAITTDSLQSFAQLSVTEKIKVGTSSIWIDGSIANPGGGANQNHIYTTTGTDLYLQALNGSGNVGIGITIPSEKLDVYGDVKISGLSGTGNSAVLADPTGKLILAPPNGVGNPNWSTTGNTATTVSNFIGTTDDNPLIFKTEGLEYMRITGSTTNVYGDVHHGLVGIGTDNPQKQLHIKTMHTIVVGDPQIPCYLQNPVPVGCQYPIGGGGGLSHFGIRLEDETGYVVNAGDPVSNSQSTIWDIEPKFGNLVIGKPDGAAITIDQNKNIGLGASIPLTKLDVSGQLFLHGGQNAGVINFPNTGTLPNLYFRSDDYPSTYEPASERMVIMGQSGNVGIGTAEPYKMLTVNGDVSFANYNLSGGGNSANGYSGLEILGNDQVPTRRGISMDSDPNGSLNFFIHSYQTNSAFNFKDGNGNKTLMTINKQGNVGIGANAPQAKLQIDVANNTDLAFAVTEPSTGKNNFLIKGNGYVYAREVKVTQYDFPDYVFAKDYQLRSLKEVESFISKHSHLPEVPAANEVKTKGLGLGEMDVILLKKVEELMLYTIQQQKEIEELKNEVKCLNNNKLSLPKYEK